jgi:hypothetical protein
MYAHCHTFAAAGANCSDGVGLFAAALGSAAIGEEREASYALLAGRAPASQNQPKATG